MDITFFRHLIGMDLVSLRLLEVERHLWTLAHSQDPNWNVSAVLNL